MKEPQDSPSKQPPVTIENQEKGTKHKLKNKNVYQQQPTNTNSRFELVENILAMF